MDKIRENRLRQFGYVMRKEISKAVRMIMEMYVEEKRERGRLEKKRLDAIENDIKTANDNYFKKNM